MRAFGVMLDEASVQSKALTMGLATNKNEISNTAKVAARAQLVTEGLAKASGDHARTLGSLANQQRKATGDLENFQAEMGKELIPALVDAIKLMNEFGQAMSGPAASGAKSLGEYLDAVVNAIRGMGGGNAGVKFEQGSYAGNSIGVGATDMVNRVIPSSSTPQWQARRDRLYQEMIEADVRRKLREQGIDTGPITPEEIRRKFGKGALTEPADVHQEQVAAATAQAAAQAAKDAVGKSFAADLSKSGKSFLQFAAERGGFKYDQVGPHDALRQALELTGLRRNPLVGLALSGAEAAAQPRLKQPGQKDGIDRLFPAAFSSETFSDPLAAWSRTQEKALSSGDDEKVKLARDTLKAMEETARNTGDLLKKVGAPIRASPLAGRTDRWPAPRSMSSMPRTTRSPCPTRMTSTATGRASTSAARGTSSRTRSTATRRRTRFATRW